MCARGRVGSRRVVFDEEAKRGLPEEMAFELKEVGGHYIAIWGAVFQDRVPILEGQLESLCGWIDPMVLESVSGRYALWSFWQASVGRLWHRTLDFWRKALQITTLLLRNSSWSATGPY